MQILSPQSSANQRDPRNYFMEKKLRPTLKANGQSFRWKKGWDERRKKDGMEEKKKMKMANAHGEESVAFQNRSSGARIGVG